MGSSPDRKVAVILTVNDIFLVMGLKPLSEPFSGKCYTRHVLSFYVVWFRVYLLSDSF